MSRTLYDSHYGVVPTAPPESGVRITEARAVLTQATEALGRAEAWARDLPDPWVSSRVLMRREAVSSSAIEGTQSTLDDLLAAEEDAGETSRATVQVRDYAAVLETLVPEATSKGVGIFVRSLVETLHRAVMQNDRAYRDPPGSLRRDVVYIGAAGRDISYSTFNPPPPDKVEQCLEDCLSYMRLEGMQIQTQSLIVRMAISHAHFEAVHPFRDGNGRTGRLLLPLMMAAEKRPPLYLAPYIEANMDAYYESLRRAQQRLDWDPIIGFMASAIRDTVDELAVTRQALMRLTGHWEQRRRFRQGSAALRSLELLPHYPILTIKRLASLLDVSFPAASTAVTALVEAGILKERTGFARHRSFVAHEVLTVINRPFGVPPVLPEAPLQAE